MYVFKTVLGETILVTKYDYISAIKITLPFMCYDYVYVFRIGSVYALNIKNRLIFIYLALLIFIFVIEIIYIIYIKKQQYIYIISYECPQLILFLT